MKIILFLLNWFILIDYLRFKDFLVNYYEKKRLFYSKCIENSTLKKEYKLIYSCFGKNYLYLAIENNYLKNYIAGFMRIDKLFKNKNLEPQIIKDYSDCLKIDFILDCLEILYINKETYKIISNFNGISLINFKKIIYTIEFIKNKYHDNILFWMKLNDFYSNRNNKLYKKLIKYKNLRK